MLGMMTSALSHFINLEGWSHSYPDFIDEKSKTKDMRVVKVLGFKV